MQLHIDIPSEVALPNRFLRVSGTAYDSTAATIRVTLATNGVEAPAIWGLPNMAAFDGTDASYFSGFTRIVDLGRDHAGRVHELVVTASTGTETLTVTRNFKVIADRSAPAAENYAAGTDPDFRRFGSAAVGFMAEHGLAPHHDVVEIGPGAGRLSVAVARYLTSGNLRAFDVDRSAVDFCSRNITTRYPHATFVHQNVVNGVYNPGGDLSAESGVLDVEEASCDLAYCWSVFTHLVEADFRTYLDEFARVLRPGAKAVFSVFVLGPELQASWNDMGNGFWTTNPAKPEAAIAVDRQRLIDLVVSAGFEPPVIRDRGSIPGPIAGQDLVVAVRA